MIPNKLAYFSQGATYRTNRTSNISNNTIAFVGDDMSIATQGKIFGVRGVYPGQEEENLTDEGNTSIKVITTNPLFPLDGNGRPLVGTTISVRFKYTNSYKTSGTPMQLNVNGIGPYNICYQGTDYVSTTSANTTFCGYAKREILYTFRVDINPDTGAEMPHWVFISHGYESGNTNTIGYQLRHNSSTLPASDKFYRYRLLFTSADGTKYVPANTSTSTDATSSRTVNQRPIDPFGEILYYGSTSSVSAGSNPGATVIWSEYTFNLGYSFNRTGAALVLSYPAPVYIKCTPDESDGSAIIDANTPYVQSLPSTNDGKIYIFLGIAYSATSVELIPTHPVYYYDGTGIRIWTGSTGGSSTDLSNYYTKTEVDTALSGKQAALVSGTNLKTVNSTSLLGSGNVSVQPTLVSGTNIKTINNESLLGSGNITIESSSPTNIEYNSSKTALVIGGGSTKYTISLDDGDMLYPSVKINDFTYSASRFPLEVNSGDILNVVVSMGSGTCTTTMGGTTVSTSTSFSIQSVSGNIEIKVAAPGGGPSGPGGDGPGIVIDP